MQTSQSIEPGQSFNSWLIRVPIITDYGEIADLASQLGYPCSREDITRRFTLMMNRSDLVVLVIAGPDQRVAGWIGAHIFRSVELDPCAEISGLVVDQKYRSQGAGFALLSAVERWALSSGCKEITVRSNVVRERAHAFYLRHSYGFVKEQKLFSKRLAA